MKIIFDTNIWISYFIKKSFNELTDILLDEKYKIIFSDDLLIEIISVLKRKKFKRIIKEDHLKEISNLLLFRSKFYKIKNEIENISRDPKDNFILDLASISKTDYIITGDKDLLVLEKYRKTKIINWNNFIKNIYNKKK